MLLIYVSAGVVLFKHLGAESPRKFKFLLLFECVRARACGRSPVPRGLRRLPSLACWNCGFDFRWGQVCVCV